MAATRTTDGRLKSHKRRKPSSGSNAPRIRRGRRSAGTKLVKVTRESRYRDGHSDGYHEGVQSGLHSYQTLFEGTSIVIPTYNQLIVLRQCINSILENTDLPYEIIVVDNASTDGTAKYLEQLGGQVRFRVLDRNHGFAGAINVGLMMSKGRTIMLLNNDTLATTNWLDNLLICLNSDEGIGMVGPVTNYISGDQKIDVPYSDVAEMPKFARLNNQSNPSRWRRTDRLTGFCLLFRRELFEGIGYFDEGYEIGNFEDDDYNIRVRMLGKSMVIAHDSFIHHFGSISMKALGDRFQEVNDRNQLYFMDKWHNPYEWIHQVRQHAELEQQSVTHTGLFYPDQVAVRAVGPNEYWIENGKRRLISGVLSFPAVRISQVDLRRWPVGEPISSEEVERQWRGDDEQRLDSQWESGMAMLPDGGGTYVLEGGKARRIIGTSVVQAWNLHLKPIREITLMMLNDKIQGLPIIAPPLLRQVL